MGIDPLKRRAVFLDRDGVLNRAIVRDGRPHPPAGIAELEVLPGVREALVRLRQAGYGLVVVTNQPDVARGVQRREVVEEMNDLLSSTLPLDEIRVCYHDETDQCMCRKPQPGSIVEAAGVHGFQLEGSYVVGDRWRDVEAAHRAGCTAIFIDYGYLERRPDAPYVRAGSLAEAAEYILKKTERLVEEE